MKTRVFRLPVLLPCVLLLLLIVVTSGALRHDNRLVVHEWGTFTALQDDDGTAIAGINIEDERLPGFVHFFRPDLLVDPSGVRFPLCKGIYERHPDVNLRLETPVLYFYPAAGQSLPLELDVHVDFRGGWLTEFYPQADASAPGLNKNVMRAYGKLTPQTIGSLDWRNLQVGTTTAGPETKAHVWNAPRAVHAASVTTKSGESEKYLFYRGVGNLEAPLTVTSHLTENTIELRGNFSDVPSAALPAPVGPLWLVHVRHDGQTAVRELPELVATADRDRVLATAPRDFADGDFSATGVDRLSDSMHVALVQAGLFDDEAAAMLATWRQSYFASPGLRLFFIVPRTWTDTYLPLRISQPATIERVMAARLELISPEQRELLAELRATPELQTYQDLGRFRSVLLGTEARRRPNENLTAFIRQHQLLVSPDRDGAAGR
jgi:hypothetical protein